MFGHYANDPKCPHKGSAAIRRIEAEGPETEDVEMETEEVLTTEVMKEENMMNEEETSPVVVERMHSILSDDEMPLSELEGTQYDSGGPYWNAMESSKVGYGSVSEDEYGFRIPELWAMRMADEERWMANL